MGLFIYLFWSEWRGVNYSSLYFTSLLLGEFKFDAESGWTLYTFSTFHLSSRVELLKSSKRVIRTKKYTFFLRTLQLISIFKKEIETYRPLMRRDLFHYITWTKITFSIHTTRFAPFRNFVFNVKVKRDRLMTVLYSYFYFLTVRTTHTWRVQTS